MKNLFLLLSFSTLFAIQGLFAQNNGEQLRDRLNQQHTNQQQQLALVKELADKTRSNPRGVRFTSSTIQKNKGSYTSYGFNTLTTVVGNGYNIEGRRIPVYRSTDSFREKKEDVKLSLTIRGGKVKLLTTEAIDGAKIWENITIQKTGDLYVLRAKHENNYSDSRITLVFGRLLLN